MSALAGKRVLVTGGAGFIGTAVVRELLAHGSVVTVADRKPSTEPAVRSVVGDLREQPILEAALTGDLYGVIHLAALTSVLQSVQQPWEVYRTNVALTSALLERARDVGVDRFVSASTNAVVGDVGRTRITEDLPLRPMTPYGATKAAAEMLVSAYTSSYGIRGSSLRLSNVFGPGMGHKDSMVPRLMRAALTGDTVQIYGDGEQVRDFVHVFDVTAALLRALTEGFEQAVIIGAGRSHSVNELVAMTREVTRRDLPTRNVPAKPGEMPAVLVDIGRAVSLGWEPTFSMTDGLQMAWDDFRQLPAAVPAGRGA